MELLYYFAEHAIHFFIASVPLILVLLQLKVFKQPVKTAAVCITLNLLVSIFFWFQLKRVSLILYQAFPYLSAYIWLWCEYILEKRKKE